MSIFYNPLFLIPILVGPIFMICGFIMFRFPPKEINDLYGYRTKKSMENKKTWNFSQKYASKEMIKLGGLLTLSAGFGFLYNTNGIVSLILGLGLTIIPCIILYIRVEKAIKKLND